MFLLLTFNKVNVSWVPIHNLEYDFLVNYLKSIITIADEIITNNTITVNFLCLNMKLYLNFNNKSIQEYCCIYLLNISFVILTLTFLHILLTLTFFEKLEWVTPGPNWLWQKSGDFWLLFNEMWVFGTLVSVSITFSTHLKSRISW